MKNRIFILLSILTSTQLQAQDETDLLRMSSTQVGGTARAIGTGGVQGSIGADFSCVTVNPAGLARYSKSEIVFTPSFKNLSAKSTFNGSTNNETNSKNAFDNASIIFTKNNRHREQSGKVRTASFGIGFNKIAQFNNNYAYGSDNISSSIVNHYIENLNKYGGANDLLNKSATPQQYLAYQTGLIGINSNNQLINNVPGVQSGIYQGKQVQESGGTNEISLAYAGNFKDNVLIGASIGAPQMRYERTSIYTEQNKNNTLNNFTSSRATEELSSTGNGFNFKVGAIYLLQKFRIGAAYHSGTSYAMRDDVFYKQTAVFKNGSATQDAATAPFSYRINTPSKAVASASYMISNHGFISVDIDAINYQRAKLKFKEADYKTYQDAVNNVAENLYRRATNIRIGGEYRIKALYLRGGVAQYGSPFRNKSTFFGATNALSGGLGYRARSFFIDAGYQVTNNKSLAYNYVLETGNSPSAVIAQNNNNLVFSIGWKYR